ncbi:MAG: hypoxanthine phosphoribosyltransferase [Bacteroidota bacterium]
METVQIKDKTFKLYISKEQIQERIAELANELNRTYEGKEVIVLPVLNGAFMFASDFVRKLRVEPEIQFVKVSTYGDGLTSSEHANVLLGLNKGVAGKEVVIVEDIVDTGYTLQFLRQYLSSIGATSVKMVTLLFKPDNYQFDNPPEYKGFSIPSDFVVGYGLDYAQKGRELESIYTLI